MDPSYLDNSWIVWEHQDGVYSILMFPDLNKSFPNPVASQNFSENILWMGRQMNSKFTDNQIGETDHELEALIIGC